MNYFRRDFDPDYPVTVTARYRLQQQVAMQPQKRAFSVDMSRFAHLLRDGGGHASIWVMSGMVLAACTGGAGDDIFGIDAFTSYFSSQSDRIKDFGTGNDQLDVDGYNRIWYQVSGGNTLIYSNNNSSDLNNHLAILEGYTGGLDASDFVDINDNANVTEIV